ncbi:UNVERIFIED_CONTAM: hypothetical protein NCL1_21098 [Trichonephila clavipes]
MNVTININMATLTQEWIRQGSVITGFSNAEGQPVCSKGSHSFLRNVWGSPPSHFEGVCREFIVPDLLRYCWVFYVGMELVHKESQKIIANSNFCSRDNYFSVSTLVSSASSINVPNSSECK